LSPTMHLNSSHVFSSLSFHTRTLGSNFLRRLFVALNRISINVNNNGRTNKDIHANLLVYHDHRLKRLEVHSAFPQGPRDRSHQKILTHQSFLYTLTIQMRALLLTALSLCSVITVKRTVPDPTQVSHNHYIKQINQTTF